MDVKSRLLAYIRYIGIPVKHFEEQCGMSNGYISSIRKGLGIDKLENVLMKFPDLNRDWLLYGEGEMVKNTNINKVHGNGNTSVTGNGNQVTMSNITELLELQKGYQEMLKTGQMQLSESQSQINRLITIIEQLNKYKDE